jgi:hypothetical protein
VNYFALFRTQHRNDSAFAHMPTESCYVTLIENAILLCIAYGLLDSYFEDVMHYGFLFFGVFIGLCACYACTAAGFCLMLLDDTTSTQLLLLDADRPLKTQPLNNIAHAARILARAATSCSVALFLLFLTVGCEFFTEDSGIDSIPTIALKRNMGETALVTQFAVSTAFAIGFMVMLMLVGSNQQLNSIFLRLQYMTQDVPLPPEQAAAYATAADDFALFVRALLGLYMVVCDSTGTFRLLGIVAGLKMKMRTFVSLLFIACCLATDALRALLPAGPICCILLSIVDALHVFVSVELAEVLLRDISLTTFACALLVFLDAACVTYAGVIRIWQVGMMKRSSAKPKPHEKDAPNVSVALGTYTTVADEQAPQALGMDLHKAMSSDTGLSFSEAHFNVDNIKMRVFEKKIN